MTDTNEQFSGQPQAETPPRGRRRRWLWAGIVLLAAAILLAGLSGPWWRRGAPPLPPEVSLAGVEPAVREAIERAQQAVQQEPWSASTWGFLGQVLRAHGYDDQSDICFAHAEQFDPDDPRWPYLQGLRLLLLDPEAAFPHLERALQRSQQGGPYYTAIQLRLAEGQLAQDRREEAQAHFGRVLQREPDNPRAHLGMGLLACFRGDYPTGIAHLLPITNSPFARQKSSAQLAALYRRLGNEPAAQEFSQRATQLPPDLPWPDPAITEYVQLEIGRQSRFLQAERLESQGRLPEAAAIYREVAHRSPDARSYVALGICLAKMGSLAEAEQVLRSALELEPDKVQAHYFLSIALYYQGEQLAEPDLAGQASLGDDAREKFQQAADCARAATRLKPDHALAHLYLGLSLKQLGQQGEAIQCFRIAARCRPEFVDPHLHLGQTLAEAGQGDEAIVHLNQAARVALPHDPRPRQALARMRQAEESNE